MIYTSDIIISDSLREHGKFAVGYPGSPEVWTFDTYKDAKTFAISRANDYDRVSVFLWGHAELEPGIPMLVNNPGYRQLA
jgi:hypothetical protein